MMYYIAPKGISTGEYLATDVVNAGMMDFSGMKSLTDAGIELSGRIFQVNADGSVEEHPEDARIFLPFANVEYVAERAEQNYDEVLKEAKAKYQERTLHDRARYRHEQNAKTEPLF